jgi:hypothetical protein
LTIRSTSGFALYPSADVDKGVVSL